MQKVLDPIDKWIQEEHQGEMAIIIPDSVQRGMDKSISSSMANYMFRTTQGKRMRNIVINPFWVDSSTTVGSQVADIIVHILMNSMRPIDERKNLDGLWRKVVSMEFRSADSSTRGIRKNNR